MMVAPERERIAIDSIVDYGTREAWLAARRRGVSASESAALFNCSPFQSRLSLHLAKRGRLPDWEPDAEQAERLEWGQVMEAPIASVYQRRTGRALWAFSPYCLAQHPKIPIMLATPDRFILQAPDRPGEGLLEVKNTANVYSEDGWRNGPPLYVQCQVQHQLAVTGRDWATVAALANGNKLMTWDIERQPDFIGELELQCQEFWADVLADREPLADGHKATTQALKLLHPLDNGQTVALPKGAEALWDRIAFAKQAKKDAERAEEEAENQLRVMFGPNTFGQLPDGRLLSFATTQNPGYTPPPVPPYSYRVMREKKQTRKTSRKRGQAA